MTEPAGGAGTAKKGIPAWVIVLIVVFGGLPCIAGLVGTVAIVVPKMQEKQRQAACMNNLAQLGQIWLMRSQANRRRAQAHSGPGLLLDFLTDADVKRGDERIFVCTGDPVAHAPETAEEHRAYAAVDLDNVPRSLCSYAGRDFRNFPIDVGGAVNREPVAACLNHRRGAVVLFEAGDVQLVSREELGLGDEDEVIVGPDSKSPMLRKLRFGDGSVR